MYKGARLFLNTNFPYISGNPVPIYRKDLNQDYIAYWQVEFDNREFIIVSAGPETGRVSKSPCPNIKSSVVFKFYSPIRCIKGNEC